ncbi:hypothetical protein CsSME_00001726 [Camellia sinensis var. sinensis]
MELQVYNADKNLPAIGEESQVGFDEQLQELIRRGLDFDTWTSIISKIEKTYPVYSMVCRGGGCFLCRSRRQFEECICNVVTTASSAFLCYMKVIINCLFHCVYIVLLCNFAYPYGLCRRFFVPVVMLYYRQPNKDDTMGLFWFSRKVPGRTLFLNVKGIGAYSYRLCRKDPRMLGTFGFVLFKGGCYLFLLYKDPIHYRTWPLYNPMASNHPLIPDLWM